MSRVTILTEGSPTYGWSPGQPGLRYQLLSSRPSLGATIVNVFLPRAEGP